MLLQKYISEVCATSEVRSELNKTLNPIDKTIIYWLQWDIVVDRLQWRSHRSWLLFIFMINQLLYQLLDVHIDIVVDIDFSDVIKKNKKIKK